MTLIFNFSQNDETRCLRQILENLLFHKYRVKYKENIQDLYERFYVLHEHFLKSTTIKVNKCCTLYGSFLFRSFHT